MMISDTSITPVQQDEDSLSRMMHLLKRLYAMPETGYTDFQLSEESLVDTTLRQMSKFTKRLLSSIDFELDKSKRIGNFNYLNKKLKDINQIYIDDEYVVAPLCYPFISKNNRLRGILIKIRVFIPLYWEDSLDRVDAVWAEKIISQMLPLPLDQRFGGGYSLSQAAGARFSEFMVSIASGKKIKPIIGQHEINIIVLKGVKPITKPLKELLVGCRKIEDGDCV